MAGPDAYQVTEGLQRVRALHDGHNYHHELDNGSTLVRMQDAQFHQQKPFQQEYITDPSGAKLSIGEVCVSVLEKTNPAVAQELLDAKLSAQQPAADYNNFNPSGPKA